MKSYQPGLLYSLYALFLFVCVVGIFPTIMDDFFFYLAMGDILFKHGTLPSVDPFIFSMPNYHWHVSHEWITYLVYSLALKYFSFKGAIMLKTILIATSTILPFVVFRARVFSSPIPLLLAILGVAATYVRQTERGSLFTDLFTTLVLCSILLAWHYRRRFPKALYALPLVFLIWANMHPGFVIGLALLYTWSGAEVIRYYLNTKTDDRRYAAKFPHLKRSRLFSILGVTSAASLLTLANPEGIFVYKFPFQPFYKEHFYVFKIFNSEWNPTSSLITNAPASYIILIALQVIAAGLAAWRIYRAFKARPRHLAIGDGILWAGLLTLLIYCGHSSVRFTAMSVHWSIAMIVYLLGSHYFLIPSSAKSRNKKIVAIFLRYLPAMVAMSLVSLVATGQGKSLGFSEPFQFGVNSNDVPIRATEFIENSQLQGNIFNEHKYGAYLAWRWGGTRKIFFHGFIDDPIFYNNEYIGVYRSEEEFDRIVSQYNIKIFFMQKMAATTSSGPLLFQILLRRPEQWRIVYMDNMAVIFAPVDAAATMTITKPQIENQESEMNQETTNPEQTTP